MHHAGIKCEKNVKNQGMETLVCGVSMINIVIKEIAAMLVNELILQASPCVCMAMCLVIFWGVVFCVVVSLVVTALIPKYS